jgi:hypothetical protein
MLDTAEDVLSRLAIILMKNGWTANDVFGTPPEMLSVIP